MKLFDRLALPIVAVIVSVLAIATAAFGQDATVERDFVDLAREVLDKGQLGNWKVLLGLAFVGVTWLARNFGKRWIPWLNTDQGGVALALGIGVLGMVGSSLAAGLPFSPAMILDGLVTGATAIGLHQTRKLKPKNETEKPAAHLVGPAA